MCLPLTELSHCKDTPTHTNSAVEDITITKIVGDLYSDKFVNSFYYAIIVALDRGIKL